MSTDVVRSRKDRVAEYVNSERMRQRLKAGDQISCLIDGNYGSYRTRVSSKERLESTCSCPSDDDPCKRVGALVETYRIDPRSFFDLDRVMNKTLAKMERPELLQLIRSMVVSSPNSLSVLDVKGFETENEKEEGDGEDYDS